MAGDLEEQDIYEVEKIVNTKVVRGRRYYLLRWKGYGSSEDTWEQEENLIHCEELLLQYQNELDEGNYKILHPKIPSPHYETRDKYGLKQMEEKVSHETQYKIEKTSYEFREEAASYQSYSTQNKALYHSFSRRGHTYSLSRWTLDVAICITVIVASVICGLYYSLTL